MVFEEAGGATCNGEEEEGDAAITLGAEDGRRLTVVVRPSQNHCYTLRPELALATAAGAGAGAGAGAAGLARAAEGVSGGEQRGDDAWRAGAAVSWAHAWRQGHFRYPLQPRAEAQHDGCGVLAGGHDEAAASVSVHPLRPLSAALAPRMAGHAELFRQVAAAAGACRRLQL